MGRWLYRIPLQRSSHDSLPTLMGEDNQPSAQTALLSISWQLPFAPCLATGVCGDNHSANYLYPSLPLNIPTECRISPLSDHSSIFTLAHISAWVNSLHLPGILTFSCGIFFPGGMRLWGILAGHLPQRFLLPFQSHFWFPSVAPKISANKNFLSDDLTHFQVLFLNCVVRALGF